LHPKALLQFPLDVQPLTLLGLVCSPKFWRRFIIIFRLESSVLPQRNPPPANATTVFSEPLSRGIRRWFSFVMGCVREIMVDLPPDDRGLCASGEHRGHRPRPRRLPPRPRPRRLPVRNPPTVGDGVGVCASSGTDRFYSWLFYYISMFSFFGTVSFLTLCCLQHFCNFEVMYQHVLYFFCE